MSINKKSGTPHHRRHEAYVHNIAPRLEGVVKNKGAHATHKEKREMARLFRRRHGVIRLFPQWLLETQETAQTL